MRCVNPKCAKEFEFKAGDDGRCSACKIEEMKPVIANDDALVEQFRAAYPRAKITTRKGRGAFGMTTVVEIKDPEYVERAGEAPHCPTCRCGQLGVGGLGR